MTQETLQRLKIELIDAKHQFEKASASQGEACGDNCDWHDNSTYEFATQQTNLYATKMMQIKKLLQNPKLIEPREETNIVGLGNTIELKVNNNPMTITLLTDEDSITKKEWLSINSGIGQTILDKPVGVYGNIEIIKIQQYDESDLDPSKRPGEGIDWILLLGKKF